MGWFKNDPPPSLPPMQQESLGSKLIHSILGIKSDVARHNDAIAAAAAALENGQQVYIEDKKTNQMYKKLVAQNGGRNLPAAKAHDGVTLYVDRPNPTGGTDHYTIVRGEIVASWHDG
jgi:hypothetical protein